MVKKPYIPARGDIMWISLDPTRGHEQKGRRPALVLSPIEYNSRAGLVLVCPLTTQVKGYPFEVSFTFKDAHSAVLVDQVWSVDWHERGVAFIKKCDQKVVSEVREKLLLLLN